MERIPFSVRPDQSGPEIRFESTDAKNCYDIVLPALLEILLLPSITATEKTLTVHVDARQHGWLPEPG